MAYVLASFPTITDDKLIARLKSVEFADKVMHEARAMKGRSGEYLSSYAAFVMVSEYNKRAKQADRLAVKAPSEYVQSLRGLRGGLAVTKKA
jgi:hypothetical protein